MASSAGEGKPAFARLYGRVVHLDDTPDEEFDERIYELPCKLGRTTDDNGPGRINLGPHGPLSRHHATISFNATQQRFETECFGKNGMNVQQQFIVAPNPRKHPDVPNTAVLASGSAVKIGPCHFYFLPAESSKRARPPTGSFSQPEAGSGSLAGVSFT